MKFNVFPGYIKNKPFFTANATTTYIKDIEAIIDPGWNREILKKVDVGKIKYVLLTHHHIDHSFLAPYFKNATIITGYATFYPNGKVEGRKKEIEGIKIVKTPGHTNEDISFIFKSEIGKVAVVGDLIWDKNIEEDEYAWNKELLIKNREKIKKVSDYIIPGHGNIFKVEK